MGFELLTRDFSSLHDFLGLLESGNTPETDAQGRTKADFAKTEGEFEANVFKAYGLIGEAEDQIRTLSRKSADSATIQRQIRELVTKLADNFISHDYYSPPGDGGTTNFFAQATPGSGITEKNLRLKIWLLEGSPSPEGATDGSSATERYSNYYSLLENREFTSTGIRIHLKDVVDVATRILEAERLRRKNEDPQALILSWVERSSRRNSVGIVLQRFITYFTQLRSEWAQNPTWFDSNAQLHDAIAALDDNLTRFQEMLKILERPTVTTSTDPQEALRERVEDFERKIREIASLMDLRNGNQQISNRVRQIVSLDMEIRLRNGLLADDRGLDATLRLSQLDIAMTLFPQQLENLERVRADLRTAKSMAKQNLSEFFRFFRDSFRRSMEMWWNEGAKWNEPWNGDNKSQISKVCALLLNAPQLQSKEFKSLVDWCLPHSLTAEVGGTTYSLLFADILRGSTSSEARLCAHRDFINEVTLERNLIRRQKRFQKE